MIDNLHRHDVCKLFIIFKIFIINLLKSRHVCYINSCFHSLKVYESRKNKADVFIMFIGTTYQITLSKWHKLTPSTKDPEKIHFKSIDLNPNYDTWNFWKTCKKKYKKIDRSLNLCCVVAFGWVVTVYTGPSCSRGQWSTAPCLFRRFQTVEAPEQMFALLDCWFAEIITSSFRVW